MLIEPVYNTELLLLLLVEVQELEVLGPESVLSYPVRWWVLQFPLLLHLLHESLQPRILLPPRQLVAASEVEHTVPPVQDVGSSPALGLLAPDGRLPLQILERELGELVRSLGSKNVKFQAIAARKLKTLCPEAVPELKIIGKDESRQEVIREWVSRILAQHETEWKTWNEVARPLAVLEHRTKSRKFLLQKYKGDKKMCLWKDPRVFLPYSPPIRF